MANSRLDSTEQKVKDSLSLSEDDELDWRLFIVSLIREDIIIE